MNLSLKETLALGRKKDCPAFAIETPDEYATTNDIVAMFGDIEKAPAIVAYDIASGIRPLTPAAEGFANEMNDRIIPPGQVPEVLTYLRDNLPGEVKDNTTGEVVQKGGVVIFVGFHHCLRSPDAAFVVQATKNMVWGFKGTRRTFIALGPILTLPIDLQGEMLRYTVEYPTRAECEAIVRRLVTQMNEDVAAAGGVEGYVPPTDEVIERASRSLVGLKSPGVVEQTVALSLGARFGGLSVERINNQRVLEINSQAWFKVMNSKRTFAKDYLGYEAAVEDILSLLESDRANITLVVRLEEIGDVFGGRAAGGATDGGVKDDIRQEFQNFSEDNQCLGAILYGEPGSGKSLLSECAANHLGVIGIAFDINACLESLLGNSGINFRSALRTLKALAGDGTILFLATSNTLDMLPQLKSRFSEGIYYFPMPEDKDVAALWAHYRKVYQIPEDDPTPVVKQWTGREIRNCCRSAYNRRWSLAKAAQRIVPVSVEGRAEMEQRMKQAHERLLSASKPGIYRMPSTITPSNGQTAGQPVRRALEVD